MAKKRGDAGAVSSLDTAPAPNRICLFVGVPDAAESLALIFEDIDSVKGVWSQRIGHLHGKVLKVEGSYGEVTVVPLYHPAAALYNRHLEDTMEQDFHVLEKFA